MISKPYYYLDLTAEYCSANVFLNGFPILSVKANISPTNVAVPLNRALIGKDNLLLVQPFPPDSSSLGKEAIDKIKISAKLKLYEEGDVSAPENGSVLNTNNSSMLNPLEFAFDNEVLNFYQTFRDNAPIEDEERIKEYALKLKNQLRDKDISSLIDEFRPKIFEVAKAYYEDPDETIEEFKAYLSSEILTKEPMLNWNDKDLIVTPYCDKRIWEIRVRDSEFIVTKPDNEGYENVIGVFVADINGELRIIR